MTSLILVASAGLAAAMWYGGQGLTAHPLLSAWLATVRQPAAWLALDSRDVACERPRRPAPA